MISHRATPTLTADSMGFLGDDTDYHGLALVEDGYGFHVIQHGNGNSSNVSFSR